MLRPGFPRLLLLDAAVCGALLWFGVSVTTRSDLANGTIVDTLLLPVVLLPVLMRWRWPMAAAGALLAGAVISGVPTFDQFRLGLAIPAGMLIAFALATRRPRGQALVGLGLVFAAMVFVGLTDRVLRWHGGLGAMLLVSVPLCLVSWFAGRAAWSRERLAAQLAERTELLRLQREQTAQLAVEVERTRLASDLDMAARIHVRDIVELTERGERALAGAPGEGVRDIFAEIERIGRGALNEMRGLLGVLRSDERAVRSPRPTLAQLETLLEEARAGGRLVNLAVLGTRRPLPSGVELATYRTVQHALVAVTGSSEEPATVQLDYRPEFLELEVTGAAAEGAWAEAAVAAARERVVAQGGSFTAEAPVGRRVLRATLPVGIAYA